MKRTMLIGLGAILLAGSVGTAAAATAGCEAFGTPPTTASPATPPFPYSNTDPNFDCMMWQTFITLNWPAEQGQVGVPDPQKKFTDSGVRTWETFRDVEQVFLPNGRKPTTDAVRPPARFADSALADPIRFGSVRVLTQRSKISRALMSQFNSNNAQVETLFANVDGGAQRIEEIHQSDGGVLIDQNKQYVYYEELLNPTEVSYIVDNGLYEAGQQNKFAAANGIFLPAGSIEVKAAWKVLGQGDEPSHFLTAQAILGSATTPVTVGLVGFHIMSRYGDNSTDAGSDLPQGVWATFFQNENAPLASTSTGHFSFFNPNCTTCAVNTLTTSDPTQVVQLNPVDRDAAPVNAYVAGLPGVAGSPFAYYSLLNVQWPNVPQKLPPAPQTCPSDWRQACLSNGSPNTNSLTSPVLETFDQSAGQSCLSASCHAGARVAAVKGNARALAASYSFLFSHAKQASP